MSRQDQRRKATRRQILAAAAAIFAEKGYEATTVDDIANKANVAKGTLYYHFRSKDDVVTALRRDQLTQEARRVADALAAGVPPLEALRDVVAASARSVEENRQIARVAALQTMSRLRGRDQTEERLSLRDLLEQVLAAGQVAGAIRTDLTAGELARMLGGLHLQAVLAWLDEPAGPPLHVQLERCLTLFLDGAVVKRSGIDG